ncbi:hypothetical protein C7974DRAFT_394883 [Boeremia exigua]|uniref:uncharacterized protein n=1 Tax=Boeremia exigua TaxID=749465 RepID=UPI001E8EF416|nr:uncharacterized protein C7974DRAFT_394883 [Boeremia exigua]KAH6629622.1 hypothetical protein C7974DRAFT_394883 [Boeremia exigua]
MLIMIFPEFLRRPIDHGRVDVSLETVVRLHAHGDEYNEWVWAKQVHIQNTIACGNEHE